MNCLVYKFRKFITSDRAMTLHDDQEIFYSADVEDMLKAALDAKWILLTDQKPDEFEMVVFLTASGEICLSRLNNASAVTKDVVNPIAWLPLNK